MSVQESKVLKGQGGLMLGYLVACSVAFLGCDADQVADGSPAVIVRDSMGVEIVESRRPRWTGEDRWALQAEPLIEIASDLHNVRGVRVLADRSIAVANGGDNTIRMYDSAGDMAWQTGGTGDGPSEFRSLSDLLVVKGEVWGIQRPPRAIKTFSVHGEFIATVEHPVLEDVPCLRLSRVASDASWLLYECPNMRDLQGRIWDEVVPFFRVSIDGTRTDLGRLPLHRLVSLRESEIGEWQFLGPGLRVAMSETKVFTGYTDTWSVTEWDREGRPVRHIRRAWTPVQVTASHREAYFDEIMADAPSHLPIDMYRSVLETMVYPSHHQAHGALLVDSTGGLWVERFNPEPPWLHAVPPRPVIWDVFDTDGAWLGSVETPARFRVFEIGSDYVAGTWRDSLDVEYIRVYGLVKP